MFGGYWHIQTAKKCWLPAAENSYDCRDFTCLETGIELLMLPSVSRNTLLLLSDIASINLFLVVMTLGVLGHCPLR